MIMIKIMIKMIMIMILIMIIITIIIVINIYIAQIPCKYVQMRVTNKYDTNKA